MTTQERLEEMVHSVLEDLEEAYNEGNLYEWLDDALDVEYTKNLNNYFIGSRIAVALGGPGIYVDTRSGSIEGYWGNNFARIPIPDEIRYGIDDTIEEII